MVHVSKPQKILLIPWEAEEMTQFTNFRVSRHFKQVFVIAGAMILFATGTVWACSTPVYRYAMYRWEPAPYEVYYFHEDAVDEAAAQWHEKVRMAAKHEEHPANLFLVTVDVKADPELKTIPPDVRKWWLAQQEKKTPSYVVVTPYGIPIHQGDLDEATFNTMIDSPARQAVVEKLSEGNAGVMVMVTGSDEEANAQAEKLIREFAADIASGKIELYTPPPAGFFAPPRGSDQQEEPQGPTLEVGFVKVDRSSAEEKWLVEALLSMEQDLKDEEFVDKPMMFMVFGRGRALPPCIGKGVNRDNLLDCVDFVTGACSCTVKDQNPGMDLLVATNWFQAADKMAAKFGAEEGNEHQLSTEDFFPDLMIPAAGLPETAVAEAGTTAAESGAETEADPPVPPTDEVAADTTAQDVSELTTADDSASDAPEVSGESPAVELAAVSLGSESAATGPSPANTTSPGMFRGVFVVGAGVAIAFVFLFGLTFMVLRPR
jgi:hypothetical protein